MELVEQFHTQNQDQVETGSDRLVRSFSLAQNHCHSNHGGSDGDKRSIERRYCRSLDQV
jgi:hypothetical protein